MRDYAKVLPSFWTGKTGKQIRFLGQDCQIIALYLLTCPHSNMIGLYYLPVLYISHETGIPLEGACKGLRSLESVEYCAYDEETEFVWVPEMAKYQIAKELKPNDKQIKGIINTYNSLPNNPFLYDFFDRYKDAFHLGKPRGIKEAPPKALRSPLEDPSEGIKNPFEGDAEPLRSQEQEQEQEQDKKIFLSDSVEIRLSNYLFNHIKKNNPKFKKPNLQTWAKHIDKAIRLDERSPDDLKSVIEWSQKDSFWSANILSTEKLRKQFDQLWVKMHKEKPEQNCKTDNEPPEEFDFANQIHTED